jgi:cathepsin A (carboxypeptidase C)
MGDWMENLATKLPKVIESGIKVLVYSGDIDYICNWRGGEEWTNQLVWKHQEQFKHKNYRGWKVNGENAGAIKRVDNLAFLRVANAGHMVPMDQAEAALHMFKMFLTEEIQPDLFDLEEKFLQE